ncbi:DEK1 [Symbiodinium sp. CCMP2456]|nr:DEK1 [Symbiodinium sp. CCMP2456]
MFVDEQFPPDESSLWGGDSSQRWCYEKLEWLRPHQICPMPDGLFDADAKPGTCSVRQGCIPDCYLVSAIALLAQQPHLVRRLFVAYKPEEGICTVKLFSGSWQKVTVDTLLPCVKLRPAFAHHDGGRELFACFLEKACAKLHGSYACLCGGRVDESLFTLTAAPTLEIRASMREALLEKLQTNGEANLLACASASSASSTSGPLCSVSALLIRPNHTYIVRCIGDIGGPNPSIMVLDLSADERDEKQPESSIGEILMHLDDFLRTFNRLFVCFVGQFHASPSLPRHSVDVAVTVGNAGGASSFPTFEDNAMFRIVPACKMLLAVTLSQREIPQTARELNMYGRFPLPQIGVTVLRQEVFPDVPTDAKSCTRNRRKILHQTPFEGKSQASLVFEVENLPPNLEYRVVPSHYFPGDCGSGRFQLHFTWSGPEDGVLIEEITECSSGTDLKFAGTLAPGNMAMFSSQSPSFRVCSASAPVHVTATLTRRLESTLCWWKHDPLQALLHDLFCLFDADADGFLSRDELADLSSGLLRNDLLSKSAGGCTKLQIFAKRCDQLALDTISFGQFLSQNLWSGLAMKHDLERNALRMRDAGDRNSRALHSLAACAAADSSYAAVAALNCPAQSFQDARASLARGCSELPVLSDAAVWSTSYSIQQPEFYLCPVLQGSASSASCSFELRIQSSCSELQVEMAGDACF